MLSLAVCCLAIMASASAAPQATTLHVATNGNDAWSGRLRTPNRAKTDGPLASLQGARDRIRALRKTGRVDGPVTVLVRGGTYWLQEPVVFAPEDSGEPDAPITYSAAEGESPVISGGRRITGWRNEGDVWTAQVPGVKEGEWHFRQLFVNGARRQRARSPNTGFFTVDGMVENTWQWGQPREGSPPSLFRFRNDDIRPGWAERDDVEVIVLQAWAELRMQIRAVDPDQHTVTLSGTSAPSNREANARYWVENAPECLDAPGEWHLDRATGVLSYLPLPGEDLAKAEVAAPALTDLVRFEGDPVNGALVHDITLRGLAFCHADWTLGEHGYTDVQAAFDIPAVIAANGAVSCALERCRVSQVGTYAIDFARGCRDCSVDRCELTDLGAGGVKIGEAAQRENVDEHTSNILVTNCHIHDIGIVYPAAVGVWIGQSYDNTVAHNAIHDTCYSTISVGWTWGYGPTLARGNRIESNHLYNVSRGWLSDLGGIYTLGTQPGTMLRNNVIHDVESYGYGGWGLYTDEGSSEILLENNIVYRTKSGGFHQHYGRENTLTNNILAFAREGQIIRSREEDHLSFTFERNIVYFDQGALLGGNWNNGQFAMDYNDYWDTRKEPVRFATWSFEEWQQMGFDEHSIIEDPLFTDPQNGDFTLAPNSPALKLGFRPIDVTDVGPTPEAQPRRRGGR
jgi:parallel beta-helix repeat protein